MSEDLRFDLSARVEVWVTAEEIRWHSDYAKAIAQPDIPDAPVGTNPRQLALRAIACDIASKRIESRSDGHLDITADVSFSAVNIDRIIWNEMAPTEFP